MKNLMSVALEYLNKLDSLGYDAYIVGGAVRDSLRGVEVSDIDIATNCPMSELSRAFSTYNIGASKDFGILLVIYKGVRFETAQFRTDGEYVDGRRPEEVELVKTIHEDLTRRDFTINAMAMDKNGKIIDIVGGQRDVKDKIVRAVGDPMVRFGQEDYIRMMRAARFGAMEGFRVEKHTTLAIRRLAHLIHKVSKERIQMELIKAAIKPGEEFARFIRLLDRLSLLSKILPEVHAMKYFKQDLSHHPEGPTVLMHTLKAVELLEAKHWTSKLATLFHDVGKTIEFNDDKYGYKMSFHRHERASENLTRQICGRLKFSHTHTERLAFAAKNDMKFHDLAKMSPSQIARLVNSPFFETLVDTCYADEFSRDEKFQKKEEFWAALNRAYEIKERWENRVINNKVSLVSGNRIMEVLEIEPGVAVGEVKKKVEDTIIDKGLDPDDKDLVEELIRLAYEGEI